MHKRLLSASLLIAVFFGADKILGLVRQVLVARAFGLGADFDAFNVANNLPDTLVAVLAAGGLSFALIPVLTDTLTREGRARFWELYSSIVNLAFVLTAGFALLGILFAEPLVSNILAPKFSADQQLTVVRLMRLDFIAALFFTLSALTMSALQSHQHFLLPALAPMAYHVGQIVGLLVLAPRFGIYGLAYGVLLGAAGHLAIQIPGLLRYGFRWTPRVQFRDPNLIRTLKLVAPRLVTIFLIQAIFVNNDRLASGFAAGTISALYYGWSLMQLPETVIATAAGTALLPTLSALVAEGRTDELRVLVRRALLILLGLTLPLALLGIVLARPAIQLVLGERIFSEESVVLVAQATQMFLVGLVGHSLKEIATRTFYAHQDPVTPMFTAALNLALFVGLSQALMPSLGFLALGLANSLAFTAEALLMIGILWRRKMI